MEDRRRRINISLSEIIFHLIVACERIQSTSTGKLMECRGNDTKHVKENLSVHETAKDLDINVKSNVESNEDESVIHHSSIKRKRFENKDEPSLQIRDDHKGVDDNQRLEDEHKNMDTESYDGIILGEGNENEEEEESEDENISENELSVAYIVQGTT